VRRRRFLFGVLGSTLCGAEALAAVAAGPDTWLNAVVRHTGDTPALERLGLWLQVAAREPAQRRAAERVVAALRRVQGEDGYLGVYGQGDRLGRSDRGFDEYWGTAELGRGLLELAEAGVRPADEAARHLGSLLLRVPPDQLDRSAGQQHPGSAALLYFLTGMARRTGDPAYRAYLATLPGRIGLPNEKSPFEPGLPPVLQEWGRGGRTAARGLAAMSGMVALARYQEHTLLLRAVRERWSELRKTLPASPTPELLARWARLTADLAGSVPDEELRAELRRLGTLRMDTAPPYTALLQAATRGERR